EMELEKDKNRMLQQKYHDIYEKHAVSQEQIQALLDNMTGEGLVNGIHDAFQHGGISVLILDYYRSHAYSNLQKTLTETKFELQKQTSKAEDLEAQVAD